MQRLSSITLKWQYRFLDLAENIAAWSKDPRTKVGAVIVDTSNRVISMGYNGFPRGVHDLPEYYEDREMKKLLVAHAERNAIDNSPVHNLNDASLFCTLYPCNECAKSIIQRGISRIYTYEREEDDSSQRWNMSITERMFREAEVEVILKKRIRKENV